MARIAVYLLIVSINAVLSAPQGDITVVRYENNNQGTGNYEYSYELSNGHTHSETGELVDIYNDGTAEAVIVSGSYSFVGDDGQTYSVSYKADEGGYRPIISQGAPSPSYAQQCPPGTYGTYPNCQRPAPPPPPQLAPGVFKSLVG